LLSACKKLVHLVGFIIRISLYLLLGQDFRWTWEKGCNRWLKTNFRSFKNIEILHSHILIKHFIVIILKNTTFQFTKKLLFNINIVWCLYFLLVTSWHIYTTRKGKQLIKRQRLEMYDIAVRNAITSFVLITSDQERINNMIQYKLFANYLPATGHFKCPLWN